MENEEKLDIQDDKIENAKMDIKSPVWRWLENFFYHYKWHTMISLILIIAIVVCSFQMCSKTSFDIYVMYAGGESLSTLGSEGDSSEYQKLVSAMKQYTPDFNEDGESNVSLLNLYIPSDKQMSDMADKIDDITLKRVLDDKNTFRQNLLFGQYQVCLLSDYLVIDNTSDPAFIPFSDISPYLPAGNSFELCDSFGVYLRSTPLYEKPGFNLLPEDTVICIRILSEVSTSLSKAENTENFRRSEELLRGLLNTK